MLTRASVARRRASVTCKRCLKLLKPKSKPKLAAWERVTAVIDGRHDTPEPPTVDHDVPVAVSEVPIVPGVITEAAMVRLRDRVALIFYQLMRLHVGAQQAREVAIWAGTAWPSGPPLGGFDFLLGTATDLADLVVSPERSGIPRLPRT